MVANRLLELVEDNYVEVVSDYDGDLADKILFGEDDELGDRFEKEVYKILKDRLASI
jgi:hypothetical protein